MSTKVSSGVSLSTNYFLRNFYTNNQKAAKTFSHRNLTESIDTFCVSMIKYNENKCEGKGEADECCQK